MEKNLPVLKNFYCLPQRNHLHHWQTSKVATYVHCFPFLIVIHVNENISTCVRTTLVLCMFSNGHKSSPKVNKSFLWEWIGSREFAIKSIMYFIITYKFWVIPPLHQENTKLKYMYIFIYFFQRAACGTFARIPQLTAMLSAACWQLFH